MDTFQVSLGRPNRQTDTWPWLMHLSLERMYGNRAGSGWIPETGQGGMLVRWWFFDLSVSG
jgi:hypothetical protein